MQFKKIRDVKSPSRGTALSAGIDFYVPNDIKEQWLNPGQSVKIPSGIQVKIDPGMCMIALNKSGVCVKKYLSVGACLIDEDYQGEIHLHLFNYGTTASFIEPGEKLVQFIITNSFNNIKVEEVTGVLFEKISERGEGGFGSTNDKFINENLDKANER